MTTEIRSRTTINVVLIIGLGALLRLVTLGSQSYSMDELWELSIVNLPVGDIVGIGDGFPPLFHIIFRGLLVGGVGDMAGRLMSATLGIVTIWVAWRMGKQISRSVGIATAFAVAISPMLVLLSQEGRAYGLFILLASLLLLATSEALDDGSAGSWVFFGIVATLGLYSHYMFALALVSAEIVLLWNIARRSTWRRWIVTHAWMAVALIPLAFVAIEDFWLDVTNDYSRTADLPAIGYAGLSLFTGLTLGPSASALHTMPTGEAVRGALPWIVIIGLAAGYLGYHGWKAMSEQWRFRLAVPLLVPITLLSVFSAVIGVAFRARYLSWLVLPLGMWLAIGYFNAKGTARYVAAGSLVLLASIAIVTRATMDEYRVEDAKAAAEYISSNPDTPTVALVWYMARPVEYYINPEVATVLPPDVDDGRFAYHDLLENRIVPIPTIEPTDSTFAEQRRVLDVTVAAGEEYLFIHTREFHGDPGDTFFEFLQDRDGLVPAAEFAGITIYRGTRRS
ncbi:MAG: hypothetical protein GY926_11085 [bacterium]|nr:hypothetical protein [bacterium]